MLGIAVYPMKTTHDMLSVHEAKVLMAALVDSIPSSLPRGSILRWINSPRLLSRRVQKILMDEGIRDNLTVLSEWTEIYRTYFNIATDFTKLTLPKHPQDANRLVVVAKELTTQRVIGVCSELFPVEYHPLGEFGDNLDHVLVNSGRPVGDYGFWMVDSTEAELPPNDIGFTPGKCMTILERMLAGLKYWHETGGDHLDQERVTCCFGTTHTEQQERPVVCTREGKVRIFWQATDYTHALLHCSPYWTRQMFFI